MTTPALLFIGEMLAKVTILLKMFVSVFTSCRDSSLEKHVDSYGLIFYCEYSFSTLNGLSITSAMIDLGLHTIFSLGVLTTAGPPNSDTESLYNMCTTRKQRICVV